MAIEGCFHSRSGSIRRPAQVSTSPSTEATETGIETVAGDGGGEVQAFTGDPGFAGEQGDEFLLNLFPGHRQGHRSKTLRARSGEHCQAVYRRSSRALSPPLLEVANHDGVRAAFRITCAG